MSKKHFIRLAAAITEISNDTDRDQVAVLIGQVCADCNPHFNWTTWYKACKVDYVP